MIVRGQLYAPSNFIPVKELQYPLGILDKRKITSLCWDMNPNYLSHSLVAKLTMLSHLIQY